MIFTKTKSINILEEDQAKNAGLKWLAEMELVSDVNFNNALVLNILRLSAKIKDVEIITDSNNKKMLIWIKIEGWFLTENRKSSIKTAILDMIADILPSYKLKVIHERETFDKALSHVKNQEVKLV